MVAYADALVLHGFGLSPVADRWFNLVVNDWLGLLTEWASAAVCWLAVSRVGFRRWEVLLSAAAVTSYAAGDSYYTWLMDGAGRCRFPRLRTWGTCWSTRSCW